MSNEAHDNESGQASLEEEGSSAADRTRLEEKSLLLTDAPEEDEVPNPDIEALRALLEEVDCQGTTVQSVAVAAVQVLERALRYEREAASAALSLGQQEKLESMVATAEQAASVLRDTLSAKGHKVMHLCSKQSPPDPDSRRGAQSSGQPWWFALTDALEVLEKGTDQMSSLTRGQPAGSPARRLSQLIAQLLRSHHDALLLEADEWIS